MDFESKIGNELLGAFEKSTIFKQDPSRNIWVCLTSTKNPSFFADYFSSGMTIEDKDTFERSCHHLQDLGYISVSEVDSYINGIELTHDRAKIASFYTYLKREDPRIFLSESSAVAAPYLKSELDVVGPLARYIKDKAETLDFRTLKHYANTASEFGLIFKALVAMDQLENDQMERDFSLSVFKNSKTFGNYRSTIGTIIRDFSETSFDKDDDPVTLFGVPKNRMYALVKNALVFQINGQKIDLDALGEEFLLSDEEISKLQVLTTRAHSVLTVENLTTFYETNEPDSIVIYLGGYHNLIRQQLILKIAQAQPNLKFFHFGDIDPDGYQILVNLRRKTRLPFLPWRMDRATLIQHLAVCKPIEKHDIDLATRELANPEFSDFFPELHAILDTKKKLEQEALYSDNEE